MNNKEKLFSDFPSVSDQEWEKQIIEDLKGADYEKKLIWETIDGLKLRPYYRESDLKNIPLTGGTPGIFPYNRGTNKKNNNWYIREDIVSENIKNANKLARTALEKGAETIAFKNLSINSYNELSVLLHNIDIEKICVDFYTSESYFFLAQLLIDYIKKNNINKANVKGSFNFNSFDYYLFNGKYCNTLEDDINELYNLINLCINELPSFRIIKVNGQHFADAGASVVQELAFSLSLAHEYLYLLSEKNIKTTDIVKRISFTFSSGSAYFLEIAKYRAAKPLWAKIVEQYGVIDDDAAIYIHAVNSLWNKTIYSPYVNMLRTTTESMAAALGGCNSMTVTPFDSTFSSANDFSARIARNQQIILKYESYFNKVADPSGGSYYIENLTNSIAEAAWNLFKKIENEGGFAKAMENDYIKNEIEKIAQKRNMDIAMKKISILGVNHYPDTTENMINKISEQYIKPQGNYLTKYRGALPFELIRLKTELYAQKNGKIPSVFLFTIGNPVMRKARASFSQNFFASAGFNIIDNYGFNNIDEGVESAIKSSASIIVVCSSDEEYKNFAPEIARRIKDNNKNIYVIVAGNPVDIIEELKLAGVDDFINIKTNIIEFLKNYQNKLGITS